MILWGPFTGQNLASIYWLLRVRTVLLISLTSAIVGFAAADAQRENLLTNMTLSSTL